MQVFQPTVHTNQLSTRGFKTLEKVRKFLLYYVYLPIERAKQFLIKFLKNWLNECLSEKHFTLIENDLRVDEDIPWYTYLPSVFFGKLYVFYKNREEKLRVETFNFFEKLSDSRIIHEILFHSRFFFLILILFLLITVIPYASFINHFSLASDSIKVLLGIYVAGATAILGIIFALYAVGFQTTTARFSSNVTDYLNSEKVGKFFFNLLTFSAIFSLFVLLLQHGTTQVLILPFIFSTFLFVTSLVGILIFKDDYITKLKPRQVFQRLYDQNLDTIRLINDYNYPNIKSFRLARQANVKSFQLYLPIKKSWSIIMTFQKHFDDRLNINESLYNDLVSEGRIDDATIGIVAMGYLLAEYLSVKHFIDRKFGWWFPIYEDVVKTESAEMLPIKANYEAMGIGKLALPKKDYDWVEDRILKFFKKVQTDTDFSKQPKIGNALILAYEITLAGKFVKTEKGLEKKLRGAYENQHFDIVDKALSQFVSLGEILEGVKACEENYLNSFGQVKTVCIDGFSQRSFPGKLNDWETELTDKLNQLVSRRIIGADFSYIVSWKLPSYFYSLLVQTSEQLNTEFLVEGKLTTPIEWLRKDITKKVKDKENETIEKYQKEIINPLLKLADTNSASIILGMFNQLISQEKWEHLNLSIKNFAQALMNYFPEIKNEEFIEQELREPIDFGTFESLVNRKKLIFAFYLRLFLLTQIHLSVYIDKSELESILKVIRRPLMLGGLAYLISELDQDNYYILLFTREFERLYPKVSLAELYDNAVEITKKSGMETVFRITYEEATRYRYFYRRVLNTIDDLPKDYITSGSVPFGLSSTETVKHPSEFIRELATFKFSDMDECIDGYVEWLKKREEIKKLISILKQYVENK